VPALTARIYDFAGAHSGADNQRSPIEAALKEHLTRGPRGSSAVVRAHWENSRGRSAIRVETISLDSLCLHYPLSILGGGRISRQIANAVPAVEIFVVQGPGQRSTRSRRGCTIPDTRRPTARRSRSFEQYPRHRRLAAKQAGRHGPVTHDQPDRGDINSYEQWLTAPGATVHLVHLVRARRWDS
jgi:hypothetical protein